MKNRDMGLKNFLFQQDYLFIFLKYEIFSNKICSMLRKNQKQKSCSPKSTNIAVRQKYLWYKDTTFFDEIKKSIYKYINNI